MSRDNTRGKLVPLAPDSAAGRARAAESAGLKERVAQQITLMQDRMPDIEPWLRQSGISPDAFISSFRLAMARNPKIANCTPMSLVLSCMDFARIGVPPDGKKGALVPFKNTDNNGALEATAIVMYPGMLDVIYRTGLIAAANCGVIYEGEDGPEYLQYSLGTDAFVDHHPPVNRNETGEIIAAWATAVAKDGVGKWAEVMGKAQLAKVKAAGKAGDSGPAKDWPSEMARKAPLRRMLKFLPSHPDLEALAAIEARSYRGLTDEARSKPRLSDAELLDDDAPSEQQQIENDSTAPMDDISVDDLNLAGAVLRFSSMMEQADEPDILQSRIEMVLADPAYDALAAPEKALVDMALRENRKRLGVNPDAPVIEPAE